MSEKTLKNWNNISPNFLTEVKVHPMCILKILVTFYQLSCKTTLTNSISPDLVTTAKIFYLEGFFKYDRLRPTMAYKDKTKPK